jgi:hypothetical protein
VWLVVKRAFSFERQIDSERDTMPKLHHLLFIEPRHHLWPLDPKGLGAPRAADAAECEPIGLGSGWQPPSSSRIHLVEGAAIAGVVLCLAYGLMATLGLF